MKGEFFSKLTNDFCKIPLWYCGESSREGDSQSSVCMWNLMWWPVYIGLSAFTAGPNPLIKKGGCIRKVNNQRTHHNPNMNSEHFPLITLPFLFFLHFKHICTWKRPSSGPWTMGTSCKEGTLEYCTRPKLQFSCNPSLLGSWSGILTSLSNQTNYLYHLTPSLWNGHLMSKI